MLKALLPGSFDPPTNGHLNLIERVSKLFDLIYVVISCNKEKKYLFSQEERFSLMKEITVSFSNVQVFTWDKLIVDFAKAHGISTIIRGVRPIADFGFEFELSMINKSLNPEIETLFIPTDPKYFVLRSSAIKELAIMDGDLTGMVPGSVAAALKDKLRGS